MVCSLVLFGFVVTARAAVTYSSAVSLANAGTSKSVTFNSPSGTNQVMVVGVFINDPNVNITSVQFGSTSLTLKQTLTNASGAKLGIYYLLNPTSGSQNVVANFGASTYSVVTVTTFSGVDVNNFFDGIASVNSGAGNINLSVPSTVSGQKVYVLGGFNTVGTFSYGSAQTELVKNTSAYISGSASIATATGTTTSTSVNFTVTGWRVGYAFGINEACNLGDVTFASGATSTRCQGSGTVSYSATSTNSTSITYSLDAASLAAGNSINASTGAVTYVSTWSGTSTITAQASNATCSKTGAHTVTVTPTVSAPVFTLGASSERCKGAGTVSYAATSADATSITYSLDAASLTAGNTINTSTGSVTYTAAWAGASTITATAEGCNGPATATHTATATSVVAVNDSFATGQGVPVSFNVLLNDLCDIDPSSVTIVTQPTSGFLSNGGNGNISFLPVGDSVGDLTFTYRVASNFPAVWDTATVTITIIEDTEDACFKANKSFVYYMPFPENNTQLRQSLLSAASVNNLTTTVRNITSITVAYPNTVIVYDHWEDGYEADLDVPVQATTQIWGDGNLNNGVAPGYPNDILPPGSVLTFDNTFNWTRTTSTIVYDAKDKLMSSAAISVAKVTGDGGTTGATNLFDVQTVKTNVPDVSKYGQFYVFPFGENISGATYGNTSAFKYTGLFVNAVEDNTTVQLDYNGDGTYDVTSPVLNQGEVWFYNGVGSTPGVAGDINNATDIKAGAKVLADKNIGVNLVFGGIDNYGTRNISVLPSGYYGDEYISSVYSTDATAPVYAYFVNPNTTPLTINWTRSVAPLSGTITVPANNGIGFFDMNVASATRFESADGKPFTAVGIVDADANGTTYDWAFAMIPVSKLTSFATLAWAPGTSNLSNNYNPLWVSAVQATTIYVKYDGDITTGPNTSPCGAKYDVSYAVTALEAKLITNPSNDNTGMAVYNCNDIPMAVYWGQRPFGGTPTATPAMDVGYTVESKCMMKMVFANDDVYSTGLNTPITFDTKLNDAAFLATIGSTVSTTGLQQPAHGTITVNIDGTITYTPELGFIGQDVFEYRVCGAAPDDNSCDVAKVTVNVSCTTTPYESKVVGSVYLDRDLSATLNTGDTGIAGINVNLYSDVNANGTYESGTDILISSQLTNALGAYNFDIPQDNTFLDQFNTNGSNSGSNGTATWSALWTEIVESNGFSTGSISITGNALKIAGNAANSIAGARRQVNLTGAFAATLSFDYNKTTFSNPNSDWVQVQVASSNAGPWKTLAIFSGQAAATGSHSFDISDKISATTNIRFIEADNNGFISTEYVDFDNVQVEYYLDQKFIVQLDQPLADYNQTQPTTPTYKAVSLSGINGGDCNHTFGLAQADLEVEKTVNVDQPKIGDSVTFTITVENNGPTDASGVEITDQLPTGLSYVSHTVSAGSYDQGTGVWTLSKVENATVDTLTVIATVQPTALPFVTNFAQVTLSDQIDPVDSNNIDSVKITPIPNTTNAVNDENSTWVNVSVSGSVTTNDFDLEGNTQTFGSFLNQNGSGTPITSGATVSGVDAAGSPVANAGTLVFSNGFYIFNPATDFVGSVVVPYNVCDNGLPQACDTAVLAITVSPSPATTNSVIANNDEYFSQGSPVSGNVNGNDSDPQGDAFTVTSYVYDSNGDGTLDATGTIGSSVTIGGFDESGVWQSNAGTLTQNADGTMTFVPESGFAGTVNYDYTITDNGTPVATDNTTVLITVIKDQNGPANDPPVAGDDFATTVINTPVIGNFIGNDSDLNGDSLSVNGTTIDPNGPATVIGSPVTTDQGGTVTFYTDGTYEYTPPTGYVGPDAVTYTVCDLTTVEPQPLCASATIHLLVGAQNTTFAVNDENSTWQDIPVSGDVTTNDFDLEGNIQTFGSFLNQDGSGMPITTGATVSGVDAAGSPVANAGVLTFNPDGTYTFTPTTGFVGNVVVPYNVCDNGLPQACDTADLAITVSPDPATTNSVIANNDEYFSQGSPVSGNVNGNDSDPQGDAFTVTSYVYDSNGDGTLDATGTIGVSHIIGGYNESGVWQSNAGTLTQNADGTMTFVPEIGFVGTVSYDYTITDNGSPAATDNTTVLITVVNDQNGPLNDPPFAGDDFASTAVNTPVTGNFIGNDNDPNGDPLSMNGIIINTGAPATAIGTPVATVHGGTVQFYTDGTYTYTPPTNYVGPDAVTYTLCDVTTVKPEPLCADATIHLIVGNSVVLPVTLVKFTAVKQDQTSLLSWTTASERNNKGFEVQRSADGKGFTAIGFVDTKAPGGNSQSELTYNLIDNRPLTGNNYYRLKQVNLNGSFEYSVVRLLNFDKNQAIRIYPNPAQQSLTVEGVTNGQILIVYNTLGQEMKRQTVTTDGSSSIDVSVLASAHYQIVVLGSNGVVSSLKFVKQ